MVMQMTSKKFHVCLINSGLLQFGGCRPTPWYFYPPLDSFAEIVSQPLPFGFHLCNKTKEILQFILCLDYSTVWIHFLRPILNTNCRSIGLWVEVGVL